MTFIDTDAIGEWDRASKVRNILAKPMHELVADEDLRGKMLLSTLEGVQKLGEMSIVCVGVGNDVWQQGKKNLFKKYDVVDLTDDGWMVCRPKPENEVLCHRVSAEECNESRQFKIRGQWGEETEDGLIQYGMAGDYICQSPTDHTDVWIVKEFMFRSTYVNLADRNGSLDLADIIPMGKKVSA